MVLSGMLFVFVAAIVKHLGTGIPPIVASFIRYVIGLLLISPYFFKIHLQWPGRKRFALFVLRGMAHAFAVSLWFFAMARIPITDVIAIGYTSPVFVTLGAALFLGERLRWHRSLAIAAAFIGTMIILRPGLQVVNIGAWAQLLAAPIFATSFLLAKVLSRDENPAVIVVWLSIICTISLLPGAVLQWQTPTVTEVFWLALVAIAATTGHYAQTKAFQLAPITTTQPVWFLQIVWGSLLGWYIFAEAVDLYVIIGATLIISAVIFIAYRERVTK